MFICSSIYSASTARSSRLCPHRARPWPGRLTAPPCVPPRAEAPGARYTLLSCSRTISGAWNQARCQRDAHRRRSRCQSGCWGPARWTGPASGSKGLREGGHGWSPNSSRVKAPSRARSRPPGSPVHTGAPGSCPPPAGLDHNLGKQCALGTLQPWSLGLCWSGRVRWARRARPQHCLQCQPVRRV